MINSFSRDGFPFSFSPKEYMFIGVLIVEGATEINIVRSQLYNDVFLDDAVFFVRGLTLNQLFEASGELIGLIDDDFETHSLDTNEGRESFHNIEKRIIED